jgi:hypothetical protein
MKSSVKNLLPLALLLSGCISAVPVVPATPENQAQISQCQTIAADHNGLVIGDFVLSAGAAGLGAAAAGLTSPQAKTDVGAVTIGVGSVLVIGTALAGFTAADFSSSNCSQVVGPLPVLPAAKKAADAGVE